MSMPILCSCSWVIGCDAMPYNTIPYHSIPFHTIPCHTSKENAYLIVWCNWCKWTINTLQSVQRWLYCNSINGHNVIHVLSDLNLKFSFVQNNFTLTNNYTHYHFMSSEHFHHIFHQMVRLNLVKELNNAIKWKD